MAKGFKKGAGGANPLNFKVVGGTTAQANPKENTIWVNTDTEITAYSISVDTPETPVAGMVWMTPTLSGSAELNVLKKNTIQIFLAAGYQYISGAWVKKDVQVYSNGKWNSGRIVFHDSSADLTISGGYSMTHIGDAYGASYVEIQDDGCIHSWTREGADSWWFSENAVDLTPFSTITITFEGKCTTGGYRHLSQVGVAKTRGTSFASYVSTDSDDVVTMSIDVSKLTGKYYIGGYGSTWSGVANNFYVYEIIIE